MIFLRGFVAYLRGPHTQPSQNIPQLLGSPHSSGRDHSPVRRCAGTITAAGSTGPVQELPLGLLPDHPTRRDGSHARARAVGQSSRACGLCGLCPRRLDSHGARRQPRRDRKAVLCVDGRRRRSLITEKEPKCSPGPWIWLFC